MNEDRPSDDEVSRMSARLVRADEHAWQWLHEHYFQILYSAALGRGARNGDAADLVQRTYLRVLRHAKRLPSDADLRSWLCCLLRCEAIDAARAGQRRSLLHEKLQHRQEFAAPPTTESVEILLQDLEPDDRELITRHYLHGWSQRELAAQFGTTAKAIESKLGRLRKQLRDSLNRPRTC